MLSSELYVNKTENTVEIGNSYISRVFSVEKNTLVTEKIINRRTQPELALVPAAGSEDFVVSIISGFHRTTEITSSMLTINKVNIKDDDRAKTIEFIFEPYTHKGIDYMFRMVTTINADDHFMKKYIAVSTSDDKKVRINYIDFERITLDTGIVQRWSRPDMEKAFLKEYHSALGQPVYINAMFTGSEFPVCDNNIESDVAHIRYYSGKSLAALKGDRDEYITWNSVFGAARSVEFDVIRADFLEYIKTISQPLYVRTQYNSWYDHMLDITAENITGSFFEIEKGLTQYGVKPVDSYVVDDGWTDYDADFWCFNKKFPNELYDSSALAKKFSSDFGLWLGPRGGYNFNRKLGKHMQKAGKGGYNKKSYDICIADSNYVKNITELFLDFENRFDINYWKIDGFMLRACKSKHHGHMTGGYNDMYCYVDCWERWLGIFSEMRNFRESRGKSLWINQTCYAIPSPWFLQWTDSIWMQNSGDIGFTDKTKSGKAMHGKDFDRMLTYRDSLYFDFHKTRMYQFPNSNMYNHEPIYGNTAKIHMENDEYRKYMYMIATRGTAFWELYYSFNLFNPAMWRINADVLSFVENNFHILRNAKLIGNSPDTGSVYGYSAWDGNEGIISLRNPMDFEQDFSVTLDRVIGVGESAKGLHAYNVIPYERLACNELYSYGNELKVKLAPHEILIYRLSDCGLGAPKLISAKFCDNNNIELRFDRHIVLKPNSFTIDENVITGELLEDYSTVIINVDTSSRAGEYSLSYSVDSVSGENTRDNITVKWYADGIMTDSAKNSQELTNDFSVLLTLNNCHKDTVVMSQGNELAVSASNGHLNFDCCGIKSKSETDISGRENVKVVALREKNGMIKLYVDGKLECSGYNSKIINPAVKKAEVQLGACVSDYRIINKALSFDEIH